MFFTSDNAGPAHPSVMQALMDANTGYASGYGSDDGMTRVRAMIQEIFEAPEAAVHLVATGTAANALTLATLSNPWDTIFCSPMAHIQEDECNAPEFYTGGTKLTLVPATDAKMTPDALRASILGEETRGVHGPQRGPVSITQATEKGTVYSVAELQALTAVAHEFGLKTHLDGARFTNALVSLGCSPAEMTWKAGIDAVSFGGTKNGLLGVEACIFFDPAASWEFELRRKRGAHLFSKHRYLSAQMEAYLTDDLWLTLAAKANAACARLIAGLKTAKDVEIQYQSQSNLVFFDAPRGLHQRMLAAGAHYYVTSGDPDSGPADEVLTGRLVCDWSCDHAAIDQFITLLTQ
ncbi:low specificity L-threonine aldolase [Loktanella salsilacus]|uniref:threonine aldolase family protein n=1 Tax=Loktanella salsilacus TaxID=195913 RepID=UPI0020B72252|nr:beta-eliminating lyase-related protein [Loktanella salsilacus]UTH48561.1 low specificity L-threonine aldolase [Loktanella salsilacus]